MSFPNRSSSALGPMQLATSDLDNKISQLAVVQADSDVHHYLTQVVPQKVTTGIRAIDHIFYRY